MKQYFYDTSALLNLQESVFEAPFAISIVTLYELEQIKSAANKDENVKYRARNMTRLLAKHPDKFMTLDVPYQVSVPEGLNPHDWIIAKTAVKAKSFDFVTDDVCLLNIARQMGLRCLMSHELSNDEEVYRGFKEIEAHDVLMEHFHDDLGVNSAECEVNQYVFLEGMGKTYFAYRWNGDEYVLAYSRPLESTEFGRLTPKDRYQRAAIDSIMNNMVTAISGPAGSGKSLLALAAAYDLIQRNKYDRVVMLVNPTKARGAVNIGYYPGTSTEKLMASFAGHMLRTKFGDEYGVDRLISEDKLRIISMGDVRGMEIREDEILYIPECQNTTIELLKLCLSRVCDGAKVIFEGDYTAQVDSNAYAGSGNGMKRAVDILKGSPLFGYVELQHVWRSKLGEYIDRM